MRVGRAHVVVKSSQQRVMHMACVYKKAKHHPCSGCRQKTEAAPSSNTRSTVLLTPLSPCSAGLGATCRKQ